MSAKAVVTANEGLRGGKPIPLRKTVSEALRENQCPTGINLKRRIILFTFQILTKTTRFASLVENIFVMSRTDNNTANEPGDIILEEALKTMPTKCDPEPVDSDHYLFILYTSGPKSTFIYLEIHEFLILALQEALDPPKE
jgi:acetyl-CoA synthetase